MTNGDRLQGTTPFEHVGLAAGSNRPRLVFVPKTCVLGLGVLVPSSALVDFVYQDKHDTTPADAGSNSERGQRGVERRHRDLDTWTPAFGGEGVPGRAPFSRFIHVSDSLLGR